MNYVIRKPPSTGNSTPEIILALSLSKNIMALTTSWISPNLKYLSLFYCFQMKDETQHKILVFMLLFSINFPDS